MCPAFNGCSVRAAADRIAAHEGAEVPRRRSVQALPKAHLHLHFTGAMRHRTLVELAERDGIALPSALREDWPPR